MSSHDIHQLIYSLMAIQQDLDNLEKLLNQTPKNTRKIVEEICRDDIEKCRRVLTGTRRP